MRHVVAASFVIGLVCAPTAHATWSIVLTDSRTGEVAVASATCLAGFDLKAASPVVVVGKGSAAAQSLVDSTGANRLTIRDGLLAGTAPDMILRQLQVQDPSFTARQYGIVDTLARALTYTGVDDGAYAGGRKGAIGDVSYAIQGNVLVGPSVLDAAEREVLESGVDLPATLMRAMLAAAEQGGDGRCSCIYFDPTGCGDPPPVFKKSAHVGYALDARLGDTDGGCDAQTGCASGGYYLDLNVAFQEGDDLDPVLQLRNQFAAWRDALVGRPDHYRSAAQFAADSLPADGTSTTFARVVLRDWRAQPVVTGGVVVDVSLDPTSTTVPVIGPVADLGGGVFAFQVTASTTPGIARFRVRADDGVRAVLLAPLPSLEITS
jgi:uncharacterized Ntn-hydrolase superfamily protein